MSENDDPRFPGLDDEQLARVRDFIEDKWVVIDDPGLEDLDDDDLNGGDGDETAHDSVTNAVDAEARTQSNLREILARVTSPLEIHAMAAGFNWDCGASALMTVLQHPLTDRSTVLLAYWYAGPRYYSTIAANHPFYSREKFQDVLTLHRMLESRANDVARIPFDPTCDDTSRGYDWTTAYDRESVEGALYSVPEAFEQPALPLDPEVRARLVAQRSS